VLSIASTRSQDGDKVMKERGSSASLIARTLGVTEGAVRYHLQRHAAQEPRATSTQGTGIPP
jgi:predicted ArsR family transcriptional regulator